MENETKLIVNESFEQSNNLNEKSEAYFSNSSIINKMKPLYENKINDFEKVDKIFENKILMNLVNDPEINEENIKKEFRRIDLDYERDIQNINLLDDFSEHFLESLENENKIKSKDLDNFLNESIHENREKIIIKNKETEMLQKRQKKLMEKNILNLDIILKSVYKFQKDLAEIDKNISSEEEKEMLIKLNNLILNDKKISKIENLDIFENLEELYLQRNLIIKIENFTYLKNLQILSLNNNFISRIENISHLQNLKILDLSDNLIKTFEVKEFPVNLIYLYLFDNLFYDDIDIYEYRFLCLSNLQNLIRLDALDISSDEKMFLPNLKINKINSIKNKFLKKRLNHIQLHYNLMKKDRSKVLNEYMKFLNDNSINISESSINFTDKAEDISKTNIKFGNLEILKEPALLSQNNPLIENSEILGEISTINYSNSKKNKNSLNDSSNLNFGILSKKILEEEVKIVNEEKINLNTNIESTLSEKIKVLKENSKMRKFEFYTNFGMTSKDIKENLNEIKMKFKNFENRYEIIRNSDLEVQIKEKLNFDQRINKVDEKIRDIDILSKNLEEKIDQIKGQIGHQQVYDFIN